MAVTLPKNFSEVKRHLQEPLIRNSFFIMASSLAAAGFGFFFWMIAARLYSQAEVGVATALMSSMGLLILISRLGLDQSVIRFFPSRDKNGVLGTAIIVPTAVALGAGLIFIAAVEVISPELAVVRTVAPLYLAFLGAYSVTWVLEGAFNALRKSEHYFALNLLYGSRILFLIPLVFLGAMGIFSAFGLSFVLGLALALVLLARCSIRPTPGIDRVFLREAWQFSAGAYIAGMLISAPNMIIPIMVLHVLGAESTASYYITYAIVSILFMIPYAFTMIRRSPGCKSLFFKMVRAYPGVRSMYMERKAPWPSENPSSRMAFTGNSPPARKKTSSAPMYEWPPVPITWTSRSAAIRSAMAAAPRRMFSCSSSAIRRCSS